MKNPGSYVSFGFEGDDFDPNEITNQLGLKPTRSYRKGDKGNYIAATKFSLWSISTAVGKEDIFLENLVDEIVEQLFDKIQIINEVKSQYALESVLVIVMWIDTNSEVSTPALGHSSRTIEFLFLTGTSTAIDIYKFNSVSEI